MVAAAAGGQLLDGVLPPAVINEPQAAKEPAAWPPLPEAQAKVAASSGIVKEVVVSGVSVSIANTITNPLGAAPAPPAATRRAALCAPAPPRQHACRRAARPAP
jgi:hypothetical protein